MKEGALLLPWVWLVCGQEEQWGRGARLSDSCPGVRLANWFWPSPGGIRSPQCTQTPLLTHAAFAWIPETGFGVCGFGCMVLGIESRASLMLKTHIQGLSYTLSPQVPDCVECNCVFWEPWGLVLVGKSLLLHSHAHSVIHEYMWSIIHTHMDFDACTHVPHDLYIHDHDAYAHVPYDPYAHDPTIHSHIRHDLYTHDHDVCIYLMIHEHIAHDPHTCNPWFIYIWSWCMHTCTPWSMHTHTPCIHTRVHCIRVRAIFLACKVWSFDVLRCKCKARVITEQ